MDDIALLLRDDQVVGDMEQKRTDALRGVDLSALSEREREVLDLALGGLPARAIAERLFLTEATVRSHLSRIYAKLGVGGRVELLAQMNGGAARGDAPSATPTWWTHSVGVRSIDQRTSRTIFRAWWNTNMDARRSISLLINVAGCAVVGIGIAASPVSLAFGSTYGGAVVGAFLGGAMGGYLRHRVSNPERAPLWALAYGASVAAILVAAFGSAVLIRPTVRAIPGLGDAWAGVIVSGYLVALVGAFLWERDARKRRFAALAFLAASLIVGGAVARSSGDPWASLGAPVSLSGFGVLLLVFVVSRRSSHQDAAKPVTWH